MRYIMWQGEMMGISLCEEMKKRKSAKGDP